MVDILLYCTYLNFNYTILLLYIYGWASKTWYNKSQTGKVLQKDLTWLRAPWERPLTKNVNYDKSCNMLCNLFWENILYYWLITYFFVQIRVTEIYVFKVLFLYGYREDISKTLKYLLQRGLRALRILQRNRSTGKTVQ